MAALTIEKINNGDIDFDHIAEVATSLLPTATDRLGHVKSTVQGAIDSLKAFNFRGAFTGATAYAIKDIYTYLGVSHVVVIAHTSTTVSADLAAGKVTVHQGLTKEELTLSTGDQLVGVAGVFGVKQSAKNSEIYSVVNKGAIGNGVADDMPAVLLARSASARIHFPRINSTDTTYYLGSFTSGALDGAVFSADVGVTLSFAANAPYSLYKAITFATDCKVYFRDISSNYVFAKTPSSRQTSIAPVRTPSSRVRLALDGTSTLKVKALAVTFPSGDAFATESATRASNSLTFTNTTSGKFRGAFIDIGPYETASAYFDNGTTPGAVGIVIRGTAGYSAIYSNGSGNYYTAFKPTGLTVVGNSAGLSWSVLGQGSYTSFAPENSVWSVTRVSRNKAVVKLNGKSLTQVYAPDCGDIMQVGFVCLNTAAFAVSGLTVDRRTDALIGAQYLKELRIYGDSTAEKFPGSWGEMLPAVLENSYGLKVGSVTNYAVAGQTLDQQYTSMQANGFGDAYYVAVCAGTNNAQGLQAMATWKTLVTNVINYILAANRKPLIILPWMWYTQTQSGGNGQASSNYDKGAPYRMAMERIAYDLGAVVVKTPEELPNPDPAYLSSSDPLLRDNIHQDALANQLYATAIAQALVDDYISLPGSVEQALTADRFLNSAADSDIRIVIEKNGMVSVSGTMSVATITNGTAQIELPRYARPARNTNFQVTALSSGGAAILGSAYLAFTTSNGYLSIQLAPATTAVLIVNFSFKSSDSE